MTSKVRYTVKKATISDKIYFRKQDLVDIDIDTLRYVLFTYSLSDGFYSTIYYDEETELYSVPSGSWHKLNILELEDNRYITEGQDWTFNGLLRPNQQESVDKLLQADKLYSGLIQAGCGWGKCKPYFSEILTNKGKLTLEELKDSWRGASVVNHKGKFNITDFYDNGVEECFEIITGLGNRIRGTAKHPLLIWNTDNKNYEFKRIGDISSGDLVIGKLDTNIFGENTVEDPYLLGILIGDGSLTLANRIGFASADIELQNYYKKAFKSYNIKEYPKENHIEYYIIDSNFYTNFIEKFKLNCKSIDKVICKELRALNREQTVLLLRGLFDTDGCANKDGTVEFCSSSSNIAYYVFEQLLNLGILGTIRKKITKANDTYVINIDSKFYCEKFFDTIGFLIKRKQDRKNIWSAKKHGSSTKGVIPGIGSLVYLEYKKHLVGKGHSISFKNYAHNEISIEKYNQCLSILKKHKINYNPILDDLYNCYATKVVDKISIGPVHTYDIQIDDESHSYVSEGIINHNTFAGTYIIGTYKKPTLVVCHTKLLAEQWYKELKKLISGTDIGFIGDGRESIKPITVGIYKSLITRLDKLQDTFEVMFVDEAHLCPAETFSKVVNGINAKVKIALSATPWRKDGLHVILPDYFGPNRVIATDVGKLIPSVDIVKTTIPFRIINPNRDWTKQLTKLGGNTAYLELIAAHAINKIASGRCLLILSERIDMLEQLKTLIPRSILLVGATKNRDEILNNAGIKYDAILTTKIFDEGISCHRLDTIYLTCPNNNAAKLEQRIGRIQREHPNKKDPLIVDFWLSGHIVQAQQRNRLEWYTKNNFPILNE